MKNLLGVFGARVGANRFAGGRVECGDRLAVAEGDVNAVVHSDQAARQFGRPATEGPQVILPGPK